jgi:multiple sugar transport system permease protein
MSAELLYLLGVAAVWAAILLLCRAAAITLNYWINRERYAGVSLGRTVVPSLAAGGSLLLVWSAIPVELRGDSSADWILPIVWPDAPFQAWFAFGSFVFAISWLIRGATEIGNRRRAGAFRASAAGLLFAAGFMAWHLAVGPPVALLRGGVPMTLASTVGLASLVLAAMMVMAMARRWAAVRGIAKTIGVQLMLIAGAIVFGVPFAWLLVTSFKEERDMASPDGIVWVPRVQRTVPYFDVAHPYYEARYDGQRVQGGVVEELPGGDVRFDIERPLILRGLIFTTPKSSLTRIPRPVPVVGSRFEGRDVVGIAVEEREDGSKRIEITDPAELKGVRFDATAEQIVPVRDVGLRWENYPEALEYLPPETQYGFVFLKNTLFLALMTVVGTVLSSALVAYAFSRMRFPGKHVLFLVLLSTMMLPAAVTMLPTFLIFRALGWVDTLYPLWVPAFFAGAFNVFLLRQFFLTIPMELEDAAKIDGCSYLRTFWSVMVPQIKPALAVVGLWTFMATWNNFMGPLIYISSPDKMPISYALQLFQSERTGEQGLLMAFATLATLPVVLLFFFTQKFFVESVAISGFGGK